MPSSEDGQVGALSPTLILLIVLVLLFVAVGISKRSADVAHWLCRDSKRLQAAYFLALAFGLFGFVVILRAGMMERWSFDRVAFAIGGFTIIAAGRATAGVAARKRRELRQRKAQEEDAADSSDQLGTHRAASDEPPTAE